MGKSEEVLTDTIKGEVRRQFIDTYNALRPYVEDEQLYNDEVLLIGSSLDLIFDRVHALAAWRKAFAPAAATADVTTLARKLEEIATPAPTAEEPLALEDGET